MKPHRKLDAAELARAIALMEGDVANARYWYREAKRPFPEEASVKKELVALKDYFRAG